MKNIKLLKNYFLGLSTKGKAIAGLVIIVALIALLEVL